MLNDDENWDAIALGVGHVAIEAARLELHAGFLYAELLQSDIAMTVVDGQAWSTVHQSSRALVVRRRAIAVMRREDWRLPSYDRMTAVLDEANQLMQQRADAVHGFWFPAATSQNGMPNTFRTQRFGKVSARKWEPDDLAALRAGLHGVALEIADLCSWNATNRPEPII